MKQFRKTDNGRFICEECGISFGNKTALVIHNMKIHNLSSKQYFDKWIKEEGEGLCKICGKETRLARTDTGYLDTCSKECNDKYVVIRTKEAMTEKYGVDNPWKLEEKQQKCRDTKKEKYGDPGYHNIEQMKQTNLKKHGFEYPGERKDVQEKMKQTCLERYGVEYTTQTEIMKEKSKETLLERYGDENYRNLEKVKKTNLENHGVENPFQLEELKEKSKQTKKEKYGDENYNNIEKNKQTCLEKYGVENPLQNPDIFKKVQTTSRQVKKYKDTDLWYQASYELDFLDRYYEKYKNEIRRGPTIKYKLKGKERVYFSDYLIPSLNLIVEIKNSYLVERDKEEIKAKKKYTLKKGYKYIMIVDKDYNNFDKLFS